MDQIRRALARWLLSLARLAHADEAKPEVVVETVTKTITETVVVGDDDWREERITALHNANRDLVGVADRWEAAYVAAMTYINLGQRDLDNRLRQIFSSAG